MAAELIFSSKFIYSDGPTREMILWKLPGRSTACPQGFKYRLHYSYPDGRTMFDMITKKAKAITVTSKPVKDRMCLAV